MRLLMATSIGLLLSAAPSAAHPAAPGFGPLAGQIRLQQVLAHWVTAQQTTRTLLVEFTCEELDRVFQERKHLVGTFRLLSTPEGKLLMRHELEQQGDPESRVTYLFVDDHLYELSHDKKRFSRLPLSQRSVTAFLEEFIPFLKILNKRQEVGEFRFPVVKLDKWYTYIQLTPQAREKRGWFTAQVPTPTARIVVVNHPSEEIPQHMPRQLWIVEPNSTERLWEIRRWQMNSADVQESDFQKPEELSGWRSKIED